MEKVLAADDVLRVSSEVVAVLTFCGGVGSFVCISMEVMIAFWAMTTCTCVVGWIYIFFWVPSFCSHDVFVVAVFECLARHVRISYVRAFSIAVLSGKQRTIDNHVLLTAVSLGKATVSNVTSAMYCKLQQRYMHGVTCGEHQHQNRRFFFWCWIGQC